MLGNPAAPAVVIPAVHWGFGPRLKNLVKVKPPFERPGRLPWNLASILPVEGANVYNGGL